MTGVLTLKSVRLYGMLLTVTLAAGLVFRVLEVPWPLAASLQIITGTSWALIFRMVEPLKSLKLILERRNSI
jgi:hypothetical protein